ncbi:hypothetical protein GCM10009839_68960 [Catenulispora yoronensis]|uniref:Uncharacterized protein n=1 Tax=Catenulispora yoronensis TaxID=450799 RepID=A0ABN2V855_9ACTN
MAGAPRAAGAAVLDAAAVAIPFRRHKAPRTAGATPFDAPSTTEETVMGYISAGAKRCVLTVCAGGLVR